MGRPLHIVVSCAQTKSVPVPVELHLREVGSGPADERAREWVRRRDAARASSRRAIDLYSGTYWATVRRLAQKASALGYDAHLWVASAGYGLLAASTLVKPYSATFAAGSTDSVVPSGLGGSERLHYLRSWWRGLTKKRGLCALDLSEPATSVLVVAGPTYVQAMQEDLELCATVLARPERLVMVTSETTAAPAHLAGNVVPSEARFIHKVGGSLPILHARVAEHLLEKSHGRVLDARALRAHAEAVLAIQPTWTVPERQKGDDREVAAFIRAQLRQNPATTYTVALRAYRAGGKACEQKRFKKLFTSAIGALHAA